MGSGEGGFVSVGASSFFFSSRRRHTRSKRDWSSDVCSSDLCTAPNAAANSSEPHNTSTSGLVLGTLVLVLCGSLLFAAAFGAVQLRPDDLVRMTLNHLVGAHFTVTWRPQDESIFFAIRLPRVAGAAIVGAALASAGVLFQGLLRNPLADPYALGVSGGAALGGALGFLLSLSFGFLGFSAVPVLAFGGALTAMTVVYALARVGGRAPIVTLLLAGFAVRAIMGYAVSFLLILNDHLQLNLPRVYGWLLGGISVTQWS